MLDLLKEFWPLLIWAFFIWAGNRKKRPKAPGKTRPAPQPGKPAPQRRPAPEAPVPPPAPQQAPSPAPLEREIRDEVTEVEVHEAVPQWDAPRVAVAAGVALGQEARVALGRSLGRLRGPFGAALGRGAARRLDRLELPGGLPALVDGLVEAQLRRPEVQAEVQDLVTELFGRELRVANLQDFVAQAPRLSGIWAGAVLADSVGLALFGPRWARLRLDSLDPAHQPLHRLDGRRKESLDPPHRLRAQALTQALKALGDSGAAAELVLEAEQRFSPVLRLHLGGLEPLQLDTGAFAVAMAELAQEMLTRRFQFLDGATLLESYEPLCRSPRQAVAEAQVRSARGGVAALGLAELPQVLLEAWAQGPAQLALLSANLERRIPARTVAARAAGSGEFFSREALLRGVVLGQSLRLGRRVGG